MPNILLTQSCVRSCPYCFAKKHMTDSAPADVLSWENLIYLADFLRAAGERNFRLLGGEPTLHPEFNAFVLYLLERGFDVTVFTSGVMADATLREAERLFAPLPLERLTFICNMNEPTRTPTSLAETQSLSRFLRCFGERIVPGFNIYRVDFKLEFLLQATREYGLGRNIRLGIAHPIPGTRNAHIRIEDIPAVLDRIFSYAPLFEALRIRPGFDCGFPLCRFRDEHLAWLHRQSPGRNEFGCGPVLDIGPDMTVWSCFPLSGFHKRSVFEFDDVRSMHEYYDHLHRVVRIEWGGLYEECDLCPQREEGICMGGCIAHGLRRMKDEVPVRMQEIYT